ncbi:asparaginase [uncultured Corynebacterium sp.]|uniref:asparaginase n=1 Tax=uncultured Corynebacterium sp. TaxID=159447 RepID=UPI002599FD97|nr:asparaginase [uncultured Corynebacterium sp.]
MSNPRLRRRVQYSAALVASALLLASCQNPANQEDSSSGASETSETSASSSSAGSSSSAASKSSGASKTSESSKTSEPSSETSSSKSSKSSSTSTSSSKEPQAAVDPASIEGHIVVLSTGGTIASTRNDKGEIAPTLTGDDLVKPLYDTFDKDKLELEVKDIANLDSPEMTLADTDTIISAVSEEIKRKDVDGVIVTHGTDTIEETAIALDTFHDSDKPVVLTGAMHPSDDPDADGPDNLTAAVETIANPENQGKGTFIAFGDKVLPARGAYMADTTKPNGFATNSEKDFPERPVPLKYAPLGDARVDIIAAYPGASGDLIERAVAGGAQGIVIEGMGTGNISASLAAAAKEAAKTMPVVLTTRVDHGPVKGIYGGGAALADAGVISAGPLRAPQARMLVAAAVATDSDVRALFPAAE